jgi:acyl-CoA hydrolase
MSNASLTFSFLAEPADVNFGGNVHGGAVMKWIDQAGYACAVGWSSSYCVTVYVGGIRFLQPIKIGDLVEVRANIILTGTTSMHISIDVYSRNPKQSEWKRNTHCIIVFVAMDSEGKAVAVPKWIPETDAQKEMEIYARKLMVLRKDIEDEMEAKIKR